MLVFMVQGQRENVAKYLYDMSKIVLATTVIGNLSAWKDFDILALAIGASGGYILFWWGYVLDGKGGQI